MRCKFIILLGASLFLWSIQLPSFAQGSNSLANLTNTNGRYAPAGITPSQGLPPPPGNGSSSAPVTPGDGSWVNVPTGRPTSNPVSGTNLQTEYLAPHSRINLLFNDNGTTKVALTFQPDQLTDSQTRQIQGIVGGTIFSTQPYQNISVSTTQIAFIQKILNPPANPQGSSVIYRGTPASNVTSRANRTTPSYISEDSPATGYPRYTANEVKSPRIQIRRFSKYLVTLGVVVACIELALVAALISFGHRNAGAQAIAAGGGLMLLLMSFAIWKVDMVNFYNARGQQTNASMPDSFDITSPPVTTGEEQVMGSHTYEGDNTLSQDNKSGSMSRAVAPAANLPVTPSTPASIGRSGLPLMPLGAQH
jgi:hypothetical protein